MKIQIHYPKTIESGDTISTLPTYSINGVIIQDVVTFELVRRALQRFEIAAGVKIGDPNGNLATSSITQEIVHEMIEVIESVNGNEQLLEDYLTEHVLPEDLSIREEPELIDASKYLDDDFEDISSIRMLGASYDFPDFDTLKKCIESFKSETDEPSNSESGEYSDSWEANHVFRTENVNTRPTRLVDLKKFVIRR